MPQRQILPYSSALFFSFFLILFPTRSSSSRSFFFHLRGTNDLAPRGDLHSSGDHYEPLIDFETHVNFSGYLWGCVLSPMFWNIYFDQGNYFRVLAKRVLKFEKKSKKYQISLERGRFRVFLRKYMCHGFFQFSFIFSLTI